MTTEPEGPRSWRDLTQAENPSAEAIPLFRELVAAMFKQPPARAAGDLFWRLFKPRVWKVVNGVAASRQASIGDAYLITKQDREDVFGHAMAFLVSGIRYQPIRNRYTQRTPRLLVWMANGKSDGRLIGFVSQVTSNYAKDYFKGMLKARLRAKEVTRASFNPDEDDEENLVDLQPGTEPELDFTERPEVQDWIRRCVADMPDLERSLFIEVDLQESTQSSAAATLGISEATASRAIARARAQFICRLQEHNPVWLDWFVQKWARRPKGGRNAQ